MTRKKNGLKKVFQQVANDMQVESDALYLARAGPATWQGITADNAAADSTSWRERCVVCC